MADLEPTFFATPAAFRDWLDAHHASHDALWVGFYKKGSGRPSITWPESVDEALCVGWIDGIRKTVDEISYTIRFTPRKHDSTWSAINVARVEELERQGRMRPTGRAAFERRDAAKTAIYSYEQRHNAALGAEAERALKANRKAWAFFQQQAPGYRRTTIWWIMSAKREATRRSRLGALIEACAEQRSVSPMLRVKKKR